MFFIAIYPKTIVSIKSVSLTISINNSGDKFKTLVYEGLNDKTDTVLPDLNKRQTVVDDPIKKLLHNIIDCFDSKKAGGDIKRGGPSDVLINNITSSGFDFNEALHPNMPLEEIMKAFNLGNKKEEE